MTLVVWNVLRCAEGEVGEERSAAMEGRRSMYECIHNQEEQEDEEHITRW